MNNVEGFVQLIQGMYKSVKPTNITGIEKVHLKCDCIHGSIVNGVREPVLHSSGLSSPQGRKKYNQPRIKLFEKIAKAILSHITFHLEDDDRKPVHFNNETISLTCQLIEL